MIDKLTRRAVVGGGAGFVATAAGAAPIFKTPVLKSPGGAPPVANFWLATETLLDESVDNFALQHAAWTKKGYRTASLSGFGAPGAMRLAAVFRLDPAAPAELFLAPLDTTAFGLKVYELQKTGWILSRVAATGAFSDARFAGVFRQGGPATTWSSNASPDQFRASCDDRQKQGLILSSVDSYGSATTPLFVGVFEPNAAPQAWSADSAGETTADLQKRFDALVATRARPLLVALGPAGKNLMTFADTTVGAWAARGSLTQDGLAAFLAAERKAGRAPASLAADLAADGPRYSVVTADRGAPIARTFRAKGPPPIAGAATVAAIDGAMEQMLKADRLRGASLAITRGSKLVYAKGYAFAEPGYKDPGPDTVYRQASVSKMFVATALHRIFQLQPSQYSLATRLQDVLAIAPPPGADFPSKDGYDAITLQHLLESRSGLPQGAIYWSGAAADQFGAPDAPTPGQLMQYAAQAPLTGTPGDPKNVVYGNYDYFLLGEVVRKIAGAPTLDAALQKLLFGPLKMTRTRSSRALLKDQAADEALYHMTVYAPESNGQHPLRVFPRLGRAGGAIVPEQYGALDYENFGGCGGLSSAVVDVARLAAAYSVTTSNPILSNATIQSIKTLVAAAQTGASSPYPNGAHGYHGFDSIDGFGALQKGGWLWSHESWSYFLPGGFGFHIATNSNKYPGGGFDWLTPVVMACLAEAWTDEDLFPAFGMPTMGGLLAKADLGAAIKGVSPAKSIATVAAAAPKDLRAATTARAPTRRGR